MSLVNRVLAAVMAVQLVIVFLLVRPFREREMPSLVRTDLLEGIAADDVLGLSITDGEGESVSLEKQEGEWVLASAGGFPVDGSRVEPVVGKLISVSGGRPVTRKAKNHAKLEVDEDAFQRRVEMTGDAGKELATLYIGSSASGNQYNVRRAEDDVVYLAAGISTWDLGTDASRWVETRWLDLETDDMSELRIEHGDTLVHIRRGEDGGWRMLEPEDRELALEKVNPVLRKYRSAYFTDPVGRDDGSYGLDEPSGVVEITLTTYPEEEAGAEGEDPEEPSSGEGDAASADGEGEEGATPEPVIETHRLLVGRKTDEEDAYFAKKEDSEFVVTLTEGAVERMFFVTPDELLPDEEPADDAADDESTGDEPSADQTGETAPGGGEGSPDAAPGGSEPKGEEPGGEKPAGEKPGGR